MSILQKSKARLRLHAESFNRCWLMDSVLLPTLLPSSFRDSTFSAASNPLTQLCTGLDFLVSFIDT